MRLKIGHFGSSCDNRSEFFVILFKLVRNADVFFGTVKDGFFSVSLQLQKLYESEGCVSTHFVCEDSCVTFLLLTFYSTDSTDFPAM